MKLVKISIIIGALCFVMFGILVISGFDNLQKQVAIVFGGSTSVETDEEQGTCSYLTSNEIVFDERTELVRDEMESKVNGYFLNSALAMYQYDDTLTVDEIVESINTWRHDIGIDEALQNYKYGNDAYSTYLESINEKHSLAMSRKYYKDKYEGEDTLIYGYYLNVLSLINTECRPITVSQGFVTPFERPYTITQTFGQTSIAGGNHFGVDLVKGYGSPLVAVTNAIVDDARNDCSANGGYLGNMCNQGQGNFIRLSVAQEEETFYITYMHLKDVSVRKDDVVSVGQVIGTQGHSGNSTGSHLHLEFRKTRLLTNQMSDYLDPNSYIDFYAEE